MKPYHKPVFRPATMADVEEFYPNFKPTFQAWVVVIDGKVLGIGGVYYSKETLVAFEKHKPELEEHRFTMARCAKKIIEIIDDRPCVALVGETHPNSGALLERCGFRHIERNIYRNG